MTLSGTLTIPPAKKVQAGVVLVSGSGPQDRDESLLGHKPFWVIADHFARHGIAVLRYDDRGTGRSTGDFGSATSWDFADDAKAALGNRRSCPELPRVPVGVCGHSEGGMIAALVAARNMNVDFIVMLAGTGVNGEQILYSQTRLMLEAEGVPEKEIQKQVAFQRARNRHVEIVEFPGLNHLFQACRTGAVSEYGKIEETLNPQPLLKMTEWILAAKNRK